MQIENATTDAAVAALFGNAVSGNLNLFGVWSRWGDVNDGGGICAEGIESLRRYIAYTAFGVITHLNLRAADVVVDGIVCTIDLERLHQHLILEGFGVEVILGLAP